MAVSLSLALSRRLQAPCAALLILGALQLLSAISHPASTADGRTAFAMRGALTAPAQIVPERS